MKAIGIMTLYFNNTNYGGILQAYALQKTIEKYGYVCKQISYDPYKKFPKKMKKIIKNQVNAVKYGRWYKRYNSRIKLIKQFELSIPHTDIVCDKDIYKLNKKFDVFVCGSDQIWNPIGWRPAYFLDFADKGKPKIAYSASVARNELTKNEVELITKNTEDFYAISIREIQSIEAIQRHKPSFCAIDMPDPTILVDRKEWNLLTKTSDKKRPYIFAYFLGGNEEHMNMAIKYAKEKNYEIIFVDALLCDHKAWENSHKSVMQKNVDVGDFLTLIKNAELVITDSFHGAVFSIIFERPFYIINRFIESDGMSMNSRIWNLMKITGLNRVKESLELNSDYKLTDLEIKSMREGISCQAERGRNFLTDALSDLD